MINQIQQRAHILKQVRSFLDERGVLEVDTPLMYPAPASDPYLKAFEVQYQGQVHYLQTSPEYAMKRLLAAGSGPIYQICKAFRDEEAGKIHSPEFTMLEWYRPGFSEQDLIDEVDALMQLVCQCKPLEVISYRACFEKQLGINPHPSNKTELRALCAVNGIDLVADDSLNRDDYLMLLFSHCIEPKLGEDRPVIVTDFPCTQGALAKSKTVGNEKVAARFELYYKGIELANAYDEQNDPTLLRAQFEKDLSERQRLGLPLVPLDEDLIESTSKMPSGCGIALGLDRLMMLTLGQDQIKPFRLNINSLN